MYKKTKKQEDANFWISYADLMAGLLFVFILLIGAIVIRYVFIQTDLQAIRANLISEKEALGLSEDDLSDKKKRLEKVRAKLEDARKNNLNLTFEITKLQSKLHSMGEELDLSEINKEKLNELIANNLEVISINAQEIQKLKDLLFNYELKERDLQVANEALELRLEENTHTISLKDEQLAMLQSSLVVRLKEHQALVEELNITKVKIKNLTGIRIKVVSKLKEKFGASIDVDESSGSIRFSSNILFNQNEYKLKEGSKEELSSLLKKYIDTLLLNEDIKKHIEQIIIEGHTNSDGSYLHNLELSQKRALEVMTFLYKNYPEKSSILREYVSASGRSFSSMVLNEDGTEDKNASRRIEIKFRIKNEKSISELQKFLAR